MDESLPLLDDNVCMGSEAQSECSSLKTSRRLPKLQFAILCLLRTLDPMNFTQIFPYVNNFVKDLHVTTDPTQIGFYSGLVASPSPFWPILYVNKSAGERFCIFSVVIHLSMGVALWYVF